MPRLPHCPRCRNGSLVRRRCYLQHATYLICIACGHEHTPQTIEKTSSNSNGKVNPVKPVPQLRDGWVSNLQAHREMALLRWPAGIRCPRCNSDQATWLNGNGTDYDRAGQKPLLCQNCNFRFAPRTGTFITDRTSTAHWLQVIKETVRQRKLISSQDISLITNYRKPENATKARKMLRQAIAQAGIDLRTAPPAQAATAILNVPSKRRIVPPKQIKAGNGNSPAAYSRQQQPAISKLPLPAKAAQLDAAAALEILRQIRWPQGARCIRCGSQDLSNANRQQRWRCYQCGANFSVKSGTCFNQQHRPQDWLYILACLRKDGTLPSAPQLRQHLPIDSEQAGSYLKRIRETLSQHGNPPEDQDPKRIISLILNCGMPNLTGTAGKKTLTTKTETPE